MSDSDVLVDTAARRIELQAIAQEPTTELFLINANLHRVAQATGSLVTRQPPGIYKLILRVGRSSREHIITLQKDPVTLRLLPLEIAATAPFAYTTQSHEHHQEALAAQSSKVHEKIGSGAKLYVFARDWTAKGRRRTPHPATGLRLCDLHGRVLVDIEAKATVSRVGDPCGAAGIALDPGTYRLQVETHSDERFEMAVPALRGWHTQVFLLQREEAGGRKVPDLDSAAVFITKSNRWDAHDLDERLTESAKLALIDRRPVASPTLLRHILRGKTKDAMLGVLGGHLVLLERPHLRLLPEVVRNLRRLLGHGQPDVEALALAAGMRTSHVFDVPPMLRASWNIILEHAVDRPELVPRGSLAARIATMVTAQDPWLIWRTPEAEGWSSAEIERFRSAVARSGPRWADDIRHQARRLQLPAATIAGLMRASQSTPTPPAGPMEQARTPAPKRRTRTMASRTRSDATGLDAKLREELAGSAGAAPAGSEFAADFLGGGVDVVSAGVDTAEAIIIADAFLRPALIVRNNTFEQPEAANWRTLLNAYRPKLDACIRSVGRLELRGHPTFPYVGTAWMIAEDVAVTNRHVASIFASKKGSGFQINRGPSGPIKALIDFREEHRVAASAEVEIEKVLFIADPGDANPDVAFVKVRRNGRLPDPIPLLDGRSKKGHSVAVIGYPANDPRNPAAAVADIFGRVFEVKRLSPGLISGNPRGFLLSHDASTLGGNSGSVVIEIESGRAVGLHFAGRFRENNFAVDSQELKKLLRKLKVQVAVPPARAEVEAVRAPDLSGREGYDERFLGSAPALRVPLPSLGTNASSAAKVKGKSDGVLRYQHFSIVMNAKRKFAFVTACNIDGRDSKNIRRGRDRWYLDPRIPASMQAGEELYRGNQLDRGHLVRRLDPVWGSKAEVANDDTFFFTNATPQHARLNQGNWNDLEDYILSNTDAHDLLVNVFTGPVFAADDPEYRGFFLPQRFWKIVVVVHGRTGKLHATGYMLSQTDLLTDIEFVFGQFRTYQVPIAEIEAQTRLNFGKLRNADPLKDQEAFAIREIATLGDVVL